MPTWINSPYVYLAIFALGLSAGIGIEVKLEEAATAVKLEAEAKAQKAAQNAANEKAAEWEKSLAALRDENKKLSGRLKHETQNIIYSKCVVPDSGVRIYNDALSGSAGGVPSVAMP